MYKSSAVALLLGSASSMNVNFSTIGEDASFIQTTAQSAARSESGVRARWVELPDCSKFGDATGALTVPEN